MRYFNRVASSRGGIGSMVRILCPPAAATSTARFTCCWPLTSPKSSSCSPDPVSDQLLVERTGSREISPRRKCTTSESELAPYTSTSSTTAASAALSAGTMRVCRCRRLASKAIDKTPFTAQRAVGNGGGDPIFALFDRGIRQSDHRDLVGVPPSGVDFDLHLKRLNPNDC